MSKHVSPPHGPNEIEKIDLKDALEERYLAYALSTIMHRALPDLCIDMLRACLVRRPSQDAGPTHKRNAVNQCNVRSSIVVARKRVAAARF